MEDEVLEKLAKKIGEKMERYKWKIADVQKMIYLIIRTINTVDDVDIKKTLLYSCIQHLVNGVNLDVDSKTATLVRVIAYELFRQCRLLEAISMVRAEKREEKVKEKKGDSKDI